MLAGILIFGIIFTLITWRNICYGLVLLFALLPTYLIRFETLGIPSTLLEVMILVILGVWIAQYNTKIIDHIVSVASRHKALTVGILLFLLAATVSVFTSTNTRAALGEWKAFYIEPVLIFLVLTHIIKTKKQIHYILFALLLSGFVTSLLAIYQHFTGFLVPHAFWANRDTYRVTAWYGFPNAVGLFLAPLIPIALYLLKQTYKTWRNNWILFFCSLCFVPCSLLAIFYAKSTGALVGVAGAIGLLLLFYKKTRFWIIGIGIASLVGLFLLPPHNPIRQELTFQDRSGQIRLSMWDETISFLKDEPLNGAGLAAYTEKIEPYHRLVNGERIEIFHHPHNIFLTMWVNLGLLGLLAFVLIIFTLYSIFYILYSKTKLNESRSPLPLFLLASFTAILITGLPDSPYIKNDLSVLFWLFPALFVILSYEELENREI